MAKYSKLLGSLVGGGVGIAAIWLASKGLGACTIAGDASTCTILGISEPSLAAAAAVGVGGLFTWLFPANA